MSNESKVASSDWDDVAKDDGRWREAIMLHDWPECGPGRLDIEDLYQIFKARLLQEVCAQRRINAYEFESIPLRETS